MFPHGATITEIKKQFIGYHIDDSGEKAIPISTGETKEAAQALAITRTLSACLLFGSVGVQEVADLEPDIFAKLTAHLNEYFAAKGIQ